MIELIISYFIVGLICCVVWTIYCKKSKRDCWLYPAEIVAFFFGWPLLLVFVALTALGRALNLRDV